MNWFDNRLDQTALYWAPPKRDGYGDYKWGFPDEVKSRWKDSGRSIRYDKNGAEVVSSSIVWVNNKYLIVGGYLIKGDLYSIEQLDIPPLEEAYDMEDGKVIAEAYARQIIDVESVQSVYSSSIVMTKVWLK
jgi:hypothetical protein